MTSPPRMGTTLLNPTAAQYAPQMRSHLMCTPGYAARRQLKYARERSVRFSPKNSSPSSSVHQCTAARSEKNWPTASKNTVRLWAIELEAGAADTASSVGRPALRYKADHGCPEDSARAADGRRHGPHRGDRPRGGGGARAQPRGGPRARHGAPTVRPGRAGVEEGRLPARRRARRA